MFEIVYILSLALLLGIFVAWPKVSLYLLAFTLPVIGWNFSWQGMSIPLIDLIATLASTALIIRLVYQSFFVVSSSHRLKIKWPLIIPFLIILAVNFVSAAWSENPILSFYYIFRWLILLYFAYIFLPYNLITDGRTLKKTILTLILSSLLVLASGYLSLYGQDWRDNFFRISSVKLFNIYPFGENHNLIAEYLNIGAFLIIAWRFLIKDERYKRFCNLLFLLTVLAIILTFSRAGWITLGLQCSAYLWFYLRGQNRKPLEIITSFAILLTLLVPFGWKMYQLQQSNTSSTENRWLLTSISWQSFQEKPLIGFGSGNYINLVDDNIRFKAKYGEAIDSHGIIQKIAAENGLLGLFAWLLVFIDLLRISLRTLKQYAKSYPWVLPLWLAAGGGIFFQLFNTSYYKGKVWLPIAIFLAAVRLLDAKYDQKK